MASENRQLPKTNLKRNLALKNAKKKNDALGGSSYLTSSTQSKLNAIQPVYNKDMDTVATNKSIAMDMTGTANTTGALLLRKNSRFIQVFVLAVNDDIYKVSDILYYHIDSKGNVPPMKTNDEIKTVAENLISGEDVRVAAGGIPMANPSIAEVITLYKQFQNDLDNENAANTDVTTAETAVNDDNKDADDAILYVWNEVETYFGNLAHPALRVQGKFWGIMYATTGSLKKVTGKVTDLLTGFGIAGVDIYFDNGNLSATSDINGNFDLNTTLMDKQVMTATHALYNDWNMDETLEEGSNPVINIVMTPK